jgi:hypothetical protein
VDTKQGDVGAGPARGVVRINASSLRYQRRAIAPLRGLWLGATGATRAKMTYLKPHQIGELFKYKRNERPVRWRRCK